MTEAYAKTPAGESGEPSAIDLGRALSAIMRLGVDNVDGRANEVHSLVWAMVKTEGASDVEAIPVAQLAAALAADLLRRQSDPRTDEERGLRDYLLILAGLTARTCRTLEAATGVPANAYLGDVRLAN